MTPILIQATMRAAVTRPRPPMRPSLAWISLAAIEAKTSATIAAITGHTAQLTTARIKATMALLDVGTADTTDEPTADGVPEEETADPVAVGHICGVASASAEEDDAGVDDAGEDDAGEDDAGEDDAGVDDAGVSGITGSVIDATVARKTLRGVGRYGVEQSNPRVPREVRP